jgi:hypothetical protein
MKIDSKLIEHGVDESLIRLLHSKTKLKHRDIESAVLYKDCSGNLIVKLDLERGEFRSSRQMSLNIDKARIRELKLNMIFS